MEMSQRAKRMERRNEKGKRTVALNLVSLMDIFTILVFFLLVNSSQVEVLPNAKDLQLPQSIAEQKATGCSLTGANRRIDDKADRTSSYQDA